MSGWSLCRRRPAVLASMRGIAMDRRYLGFVLLGLITAAAGCTHTTPLARTDTPSAPPSATGDGAAMTHKAPTYVAFADMVASAAFLPDKTPQQRQVARDEA